MSLRVNPLDAWRTAATPSLASLDPVHAVPALHAYRNRHDLFARDLEKHFDGDPAALLEHVMRLDEAEQAAALNHGASLRAYLGLGREGSRGAVPPLPDAEAPRALARAAGLLREPLEQGQALDRLGAVLGAQRADGSAADPANREKAAAALLEVLGRLSSLRGDRLKDKLLQVAAAHRSSLDERQQDALNERLTRLSRADERKFRNFIQTHLPPSKSARKRRPRPPGGATRARLLRLLAAKPRPAERGARREMPLPPAADSGASITQTAQQPFAPPPAEAGVRVEPGFSPTSVRAARPSESGDLLYLNPERDAHYRLMRDAENADAPPASPRHRNRAPAPGQPAVRTRAPRNARRQPTQEPFDELARESDTLPPGISLAELTRMRRTT